MALWGLLLCSSLNHKPGPANRCFEAREVHCQLCDLFLSRLLDLHLSFDLCFDLLNLRLSSLLGLPLFVELDLLLPKKLPTWLRGSLACLFLGHMLGQLLHNRMILTELLGELLQQPC